MNPELLFLIGLGAFSLILSLFWRRGRGIFVASVALCASLVSLSLFSPMLFRQTGARTQPLNPPWPFEPPTDKFNLGVRLELYDPNDLSRCRGDPIELYMCLEKDVGYLFTGPMLSLDGNRWVWDTSKAWVKFYSPLTYSLSGRTLSFYGKGMGRAVELNLDLRLLDAEIVFDLGNPSFSIRSNFPSALMVIVEEKGNGRLYVNGYTPDPIFLLRTRNLEFRYRPYSSSCVLGWGRIGREQVVFRYEDGDWVLERSFPQEIVDTDFTFYFRYEVDGEYLTETFSGKITSLLSISFSKNEVLLSLFGVKITGSLYPVRAKEWIRGSTITASVEYQGTMSDSLRNETLFVKIYACGYGPYQPESAPLSAKTLHLSYKLAFQEIKEGFLVSLDAWSMTGEYLPEETRARIVSPIQLPMTKVEKDEWVCLVPKEYEGRTFRITIEAPGYLPYNIDFVLMGQVPKASLCVNVLDAVTGERARGTFRVSVSDGEKSLLSMENPAVFHDLRTSVSVSVVPLDAGYYPVRRSVTLEPWSMNVVNIYLQRVPSLERGTSSLLLVMDTSSLAENRVSVFLAGTRWDILWEPYWSFIVDGKEYRPYFSEGRWQVEVDGIRYEAWLEPPFLYLRISGVGAGVYPVTVVSPWCEGQSLTVSLREGREERVDVALKPMPVSPGPVGDLRVEVVDKKTGEPIIGATVVLSSGESAVTDWEGCALFRSLPEGAYTVSVVARGYFDKTKKVSVRAGVTTTVRVELGSFLFEIEEGRVRARLERVVVTFFSIMLLAGVAMAWRRS